MAYLVDTSVWIDYFREKNNSAVQFLIKILDEQLPFGITAVVYQELLQGAASTKDFRQLVQYFSTQLFFQPKDSVASYEAAAKIFFDCRRAGITVRGAIDCLVAQIAIEHDLILLHNDKDYERMAAVVRDLKVV